MRTTSARWGRSMVKRQERDSPLRVITLAGFERSSLNTRYVEKRGSGALVNGRETFWSEDGDFFLFWCKRELRWKCSRAVDLPNIVDGASNGYISAPREAHVLSPWLLKGWHEWC